MRVDDSIELGWEHVLAGIRQQAEWLRPRELWAKRPSLLTSSRGAST